MRLRPTALALSVSLATVATLSLAACGAGGDGEGADSADSAAESVSVATGSEAPAGSAAPTELAEADLDAYERALTAEVELLREAVRQRDAARTDADTLNAMTAAMEAQTVPAAAERAGIPEDHYRRLDDAFGRAVGARLQNPGMRSMMANPDTSFLADLPAAQAEQQRAQLRENLRQAEAAYGDSATYASVPPALLEPFKARAAATLEALWRERMELRLKAAGLAR
jgi:hypothetical protein